MLQGVTWNGSRSGIEASMEGINIVVACRGGGRKRATIGYPDIGAGEGIANIKCHRETTRARIENEKGIGGILGQDYEMIDSRLVMEKRQQEQK